MDVAPDASEVRLLELRGHLADNGGLRACLFPAFWVAEPFWEALPPDASGCSLDIRLSLLLRAVPAWSVRGQ